jgi:hypothetical protein
MRHFLENLTGLSIYPLLGLSIFLGFFLAVLLQMVLTKRSHYAEMASIPLDESLPIVSNNRITPPAKII